MDAAKAAGDNVTVEFTKDLAADDLGDREVMEPAVILIGEFLRSHLAKE